MARVPPLEGPGGAEGALLAACEAEIQRYKLLQEEILVCIAACVCVCVYVQHRLIISHLAIIHPRAMSRTLLPAGSAWFGAVWLASR